MKVRLEMSSEKQAAFSKDNLDKYLKEVAKEYRKFEQDYPGVLKGNNVNVIAGNLQKKASHDAVLNNLRRQILEFERLRHRSSGQ